MNQLVNCSLLTYFFLIRCKTKADKSSVNALKISRTERPRAPVNKQDVNSHGLSSGVESAGGGFVKPGRN